MVARHQLGAVRGDDRQHRIGDPGKAGGVRCVLLGVVSKLGAGEQVFRIGECRHPAAVLEPGIPADMVAVQVGAHDVVDVGDGEPGGGEVALIAVARHAMPERPLRPLLVIADAGVDQDGVGRRLDEIALNTEHQLAAGQVLRLEPMAMRRQHFFRQRREELGGTEQRRFLLDDAMDRDVAEADRLRRGCDHSRPPRFRRQPRGFQVQMESRKVRGQHRCHPRPRAEDPSRSVNGCSGWRASSRHAGPLVNRSRHHGSSG